MNRIHMLVLTLVGAIVLLFSSCQKAPELTITSSPTVELNVEGSSGTITFTANRAWTVSSSDSWVNVSPSSGEASDKPVTVTVRCNANTTYDDRTATVTIRMEDLSQSVTIKQPANKGVVLPKQVFDLQSDAKTIDVEVQANVDYTVETSVDWIKQTGTKGLTSSTLNFNIEENKTYDAREGKITIKPKQAGVTEQVISVRQAQKDALIVEKTSYDMPYGGGEIEIKVEANVAYDVTPNVDWLHYVSTKALSSSTVVIKVDENATYSSREGKIEIAQQNGSLKHTVTVKQAGRIAVTSVELDQTSLALKPEDTVTLVATVKPDNATDKTVTWTSSDANVASVNDGGVVIAIADGEAIITATAGEKKATCKVTVKDPLNEPIVFADAKIKEKLIAAFDSNNDGELSFKEAAMVTSGEALKNAFGTEKKYTSFDEFQYFTGITAIPENMFNGWNITSIILPTSIMTIGRYAFQSCIKLLSISIPETVTTISDYALSGCSSLTTLILPEGLTFIGAGLLWDCTGLSSITLPQSITSIGTHAFTNCKKLVSLEIPESVTKIGDYVFLDCECLTSIILPKGISFIGGHAFENCISLTSITIPNEVITISSCAFRHCDSLNSVVLSEKIATIGSEAFRWCGNLTSISIPESIYEIEDDAFKDCTSMTSIYIYSNDPPRSAPGIFDNTNDAPIYVPSQSLTAYKSADIWSVYSDRIFVLPPTAVDLGLSVKWASMNVGALTPEGFGDYYAWGETETKDDYSWITYKFRISGDAQDNVKLSKYVTEWAFGEVDNKSVLDPEDDVAHVKFGGNWRIPTKEEQDELRNQCTWTWTTVNGVKGYEVKSNVNSNSIFLPAAGHRYSTQLMYAGSLGYYGSASLSLPAHPIYAGRIYFHSNGVIRDGAYDRYAGFPVRPVTE